MSHPDSEPGRLLSGAALRDALDAGKVFRPGSFVQANIRASGYDLRLAGSPLVRPGRPGSADYVAYEAEPSGNFILAPGDSALIATTEVFALDFGISSMIGQKFGWAAQGIIMLQGAVAHPGYGLSRDADGNWAPGDVRLYFVIVNVGPDQVALRPGDSIAYLQFFSVERDDEPVEVPSDGYAHLRRTLFSGDSPGGAKGLSYFRGITARQDEMTAAITRVAEDEAALQTRVEAQLADFRAELDKANTGVDRVSNASNMVVVFGVFLVTATLLGVALTVLTGLINSTVSPHGWRLFLLCVLGLVFTAAVIYPVALVTRATRDVVASHKGGGGAG
jgi:deoxycytidine triphosphate deaminase